MKSNLRFRPIGQFRVYKSIVQQLHGQHYFWGWEKIVLTKGHSLCKQCLHDLQFMKKGSSSPSGVFSTGAMGALAPAIFGHFITVSQGQHPQWKNSINILAPAILKS